MIHPNIKFLRAVGTMMGGIVGVGVFGLPFAFAQAGFVVGALWLVVLAALLVTMQLMYAEVVTQTEGTHRLGGYVEKYLGARWGQVAMLAVCGSLWGAMIAYLIVGGRFLHLLFSPAFGGPEWAYGLALGLIGGALVWRGLKFVSKIEVWIIGAMLFLFVFMILSALPHLQVANLTTFLPMNALVPYGVIFFALSGIGVVPEMKFVLGRNKGKELPHAILIGMAIVIVLYFFFALAVVGATGGLTTETAFDGLVPLIGPTFGVVGALLSSITILSSFVILGLELQNAFRYDRNLGHKPSFALVIAVPILLYLLGVQEFISVIGFVGAVFSGLLGVLVVMVYERMRRSPVCEKHTCLDVPHVVSWLLIAVFIAGAVTAVASLFL